MLTAKLILERFSKDGRLLERREQPSRSFLVQFIELLYVASAQIQDGAPYIMTDIDGNPQDIDGRTDPFGGLRRSKSNIRLGSPPGDSGVYCHSGGQTWLVGPNTIVGDEIGIQVGTGVGVVTPTDTAMGTRIAHGRGGGELEYGGCELVGIAFANPNGEFTIRRYFTNNSGGGITVEEVGLYTVGVEFNAGAWPFCAARDLTGGVAVANTELLRATYVVQITV